MTCSFEHSDFVPSDTGWFQTPEGHAAMMEVWAIQAEKDALMVRSTNSGFADVVMSAHPDPHEKFVFLPSNYGKVGTQLMLI